MCMWMYLDHFDGPEQNDLCLFDECRTSTECIRCGSDERAFSSCHCVLLGLVFRLLCIVYPYTQFCALLLVLVVLLLLLLLLPPLQTLQLFSFNSNGKVFPDGTLNSPWHSRINNSGSTAGTFTINTAHRVRDGNVAKSASHQLSHTCVTCLLNEPKDGTTWNLDSRLTSTQKIKAPESSHVQMNTIQKEFYSMQ